MVDAEWTKFTEADIDERGAPVGLWKAALTDTDDNTYRVCIARDAVASNREGEPNIIRFEELSTPFTKYTQANAERIVNVMEAAVNIFEDDVPYHAVYTRRPELYRARLSTSHVPARGNTGPHPLPAVSEARARFIHEGHMVTAVVDDAHDMTHDIHFAPSPNPQVATRHLNHTYTPYARVTARTLSATFEAIRAAQRELLAHDYRLSLNSTINIGQILQVKPTDEELAALSA